MLENRDEEQIVVDKVYWLHLPFAICHLPLLFAEISKFGTDCFSGLRPKKPSKCWDLLSLKEQDCEGVHIEIDEVLRLVCDEASEVSPNNAMPCRSFPSIELTVQSEQKQMMRTGIW